MDWNRLNQHLQDSAAEFSLAEVHGHLCGRLVGGHVLLGTSGKRIIEDLLNLQSGEQPGLVEDFLALMQESDRQLETASFGFELLLPDDDMDLAARLQGLADWCGGLLEGLGHTLAVAEHSQDAEVREILGDLAEIAKLSTEVEEINENEVYYAEIYEYVRIAVMNLHALFRAAALDEADESSERH